LILMLGFRLYKRIREKNWICYHFVWLLFDGLVRYLLSSEVKIHYETL
jgi:hypothetical protein